MSTPHKVLLLVFAWLTFVTVLHLGLNTRLLEFGSCQHQPANSDFKVGFLPVT